MNNIDRLILTVRRTMEYNEIIKRKGGEFPSRIKKEKPLLSQFSPVKALDFPRDTFPAGKRLSERFTFDLLTRLFDRGLFAFEINKAVPFFTAKIWADDGFFSQRPTFLPFYILFILDNSIKSGHRARNALCTQKRISALPIQLLSLEVLSNLLCYRHYDIS